MQGLILDSKYETLDVVDVFKSLIWTDRYNEPGDFELIAHASAQYVPHLKEDNYFMIQGSDRLMVIESVETNTDVLEGVLVTATGRSLESILDRRIIWDLTTFKGKTHEFIKKALDENAIDPEDQNRRIPGLTFKPVTDEASLEMNTDVQYFGDNLLATIQKLCKYHKLGFKVLPSGEGGFEFSLYLGVDRSYEQEDRPYIVFSPGFENIVSSNSLTSHKGYRNASLVTTEKTVTKQVMDTNGNTTSVTEQLRVSTEIYVGEERPFGLNRRELFVDIGGIESETEDGVELTDAEYLDKLKVKGREEMRDYPITATFDGEVEAVRQYVYGVDFFLGDYVQFVDPIGTEARVRVDEVIRSHDADGEITTPSFKFASQDTDDEE